MLDESAGRSLIRGTVQAIANGIASCQGEVLSLTRDILVIQPPIQGSREVGIGTFSGFENWICSVSILEVLVVLSDTENI